MKKKVILILSDGMKGDSVLSCKHPFAKYCVDHYASKLDVQTVMPSVTLPCHMSLFLSVPPTRHGILTNTYVPQVRLVKSLFTQLKNHQKTSAMFYNWGELRDLSLPGDLSYSLLASEGIIDGSEETYLTQSAIDYIQKNEPDFVFLYFGGTDSIGHHYGWETPEYHGGICHSFDCIEKIYHSIPKDYTIMITSDHGGHDRSHGHDIPEDMMIPLLIISDDFPATTSFLNDTTIMDIAPTISQILNIPVDSDWEGRSLV